MTPLIRWWRVQRAYALLRMALRLRRGLPGYAVLALAKYATSERAFCGEATPPEITSALAVIESGGTIKPEW